MSNEYWSQTAANKRLESKTAGAEASESFDSQDGSMSKPKESRQRGKKKSQYYN